MTALSLSSPKPWLAFIRLALPILVAELLHLSATVVDTIMAGQYSALDLAGVSVGGSILFPLLMLLVGICMATTPSVAQLFGAEKTRDIGALVQQSLWLALALGIIGVMLVASAHWALQWLDYSDELKRISQGYLVAASLSLPAVVLMQSLRSFCEGMGNTRPIVYFGILAAVVNIPMNYMFIYGKWGAPALGGVGCGWATTISAWVSLLGMAIYIYAKPVYHQCGFFLKLYVPQIAPIKALVTVGVPIGISIFIEATMFAIIALFLAPLGDTIVAGHQIVLNFSSVIFMVPMSISIALTIRVGQSIGANDPMQAKQVTKMGYSLALMLSMASCTLMWLAPEPIARIYTQDKEVIALAASLFALAALFQLSDALQIASAGILRGHKDTRWPMVIVVISYWIIGLPLGYVLGRTDILAASMGAAGFWVGLIIGLTCAAVLLGYRVVRITKRL